MAFKRMMKSCRFYIKSGMDYKGNKGHIEIQFKPVNSHITYATVVGSTIKGSERREKATNATQRSI